MLDIAPERVAHVIVQAREIDGQVASWDEPGDENSSDAILESRSGRTTGLVMTSVR